MSLGCGWFKSQLVVLVVLVVLVADLHDSSELEEKLFKKEVA